MKRILILLLLLPIITFAQKEVIIHIQTDNYPSETKWTLYKDAYQGDTLAYVPYGYYTQVYTPRGQCHNACLILHHHQRIVYQQW